MAFFEMCRAGLAPPQAGWTAGHAALTFLMWVLMMVAMMLPGAAPAIVNGARAARARTGTVLRRGFSFAAGYVLVWTVFALAATGLQWWLESRLLLSQSMALNNVFVAAPWVMAIGFYQLTPFKLGCRGRCFQQGEDGARAADGSPVPLGMRHGLDCLGCCAPLMCLAFVAGTMNVAAMALVAAWAAAEKVAPWGGVFARLSGAALVIAGGAALAMAL